MVNRVRPDWLKGCTPSAFAAFSDSKSGQTVVNQQLQTSRIVLMGDCHFWRSNFLLSVFLVRNRGFECFDSRFCGTSVSCWLFKYRVSALAGFSFNMWLIPKSGSLRSFSRSYIRYALGPVHLHRRLFASCIFKPILVTWFIMMKGLLLV